jgi:excisionase family DNA binding protein
VDKHTTTTTHAVLSVKQTADYLRISPSTLYRLVKAGAAPRGAYRADGGLRFDAARLARWLREQGATSMPRWLAENLRSPGGLKSAEAAAKRRTAPATRA